MTESSLPVATIRRCLYRDLDRVIPIYNHYVSNTIVSLDLDTKPILYMQKLYNSVLDQDLPFLIVTISNDHNPARKEEDIIGYAYANFYRRLPAFGGTVEILIYLDPNATGQGIGKRLLDVLMVTLKEVTPATDRDHGIREVLAIVPVDEGRDASGFFRKGGFEDRGLLKGVGWYVYFGVYPSCSIADSFTPQQCLFVGAACYLFGTRKLLHSPAPSFCLGERPGFGSKRIFQLSQLVSFLGITWKQRH